jgi:hypothetical protein
MRGAAFLLLIALGAASADTQVYRWVDKDGKVHYSDQPVAGAEKVELKPINEVPGVPVEQPPARDEPPAEPLDSATSYSAMTITSPKEGETLRGSGIGLSISVDLQPALGGDDRIEYLLDGKPVGASIPYVERGTHTVSARVVDPDGRTKISATPVKFTVFQNVAPPPPQAKPKKP